MSTLVRDQDRDRSHDGRTETGSRRSRLARRSRSNDPDREPPGRGGRQRDTTSGDDQSIDVGWDDTGRRSIDPRIKARREAVLHGHRRRRRRRLMTALVLLSVLAGCWLAAKSSLLTVESVDVTPSPNAGAEAIREAAGIGVDLNMLELDESAIARKVEALPWVGRATVERRWPKTVSIAVTERTIRAVVPDGSGGWLLVDETGRVLGPTPPVSHQFVPHIIGLAPVAPGQSMDPKIAGALAVSSKMTVSLGGRIASLTVTPEGTVDAKLQPRGTAWLGRVVDGAGRPESDLDDKVRALQTMLAQADLRDLCRLDLRVPSSPVLTRDPQCA